MNYWFGMEVIYSDGRKMLLYNQFDLGMRYKIYTINSETNQWEYSNSFITIGEAKKYYDKIYSEGCN